MKTVLNQLEQVLQQKRSAYFCQLQPGLSLSEIEQLENKYKVKLPLEIREIYQWKNGQVPNCAEALVNNSMFTPLEELLSTKQMLDEMIGYDFDIENWWNIHWFPLFSNGGGSYICYDEEGTFTGNKGQILEYWKADNDRVIIAHSLKDFLSVLAEYYKITLIEDFDELFDISDMLQASQPFIVDKPL